MNDDLGDWIDCAERLPRDGQDVLFVVRVDQLLPMGYLNGRVLGGRYRSGGEDGAGLASFSVPGLAVDAWFWQPSPPAPVLVLKRPNARLSGPQRPAQEVEDGTK